MTALEPPTVEAQFKLELMRVIDSDLRRRYRTQLEAAEAVGIEVTRFSKFRALRHDLFSVAWIFELAELPDIPIRITIDGPE